MDEDLHNHVLKFLKEDIRLDGRKPLEYRKPLKIEYDVTKTACGSAKVTLGDTEVMVGIKFELGTPYPDNPDEGTIIVGAELYPMCNPEFESGPPGIQSIEIARVVDRGIRESKAIDFKKLCIKKGEKAWIVSIDIAPINDAGNLFDVSALAALAALKVAKFPKLDENDKIDYKAERKEKIKLEKEPVSVTVHKIGETYIVDPTTEEEKVSEARLTVASMKDGTLCAMQKGGDTPLDKEDIKKMIDIAIDKAKELRGCIIMPEAMKYSRFEKARMIGSRALQIGMGAKPLVKLTDDDLKKIKYNPIEIAKMEYDQGIIPLEVKRRLPKRTEAKKE